MRRRSLLVLLALVLAGCGNYTINTSQRCRGSDGAFVCSGRIGRLGGAPVLDVGSEGNLRMSGRLLEGTFEVEEGEVEVSFTDANTGERVAVIVRPGSPATLSGTPSYFDGEAKITLTVLGEAPEGESPQARGLTYEVRLVG